MENGFLKEPHQQNRTEWVKYVNDKSEPTRFERFALKALPVALDYYFRGERDLAKSELPQDWQDYEILGNTDADLLGTAANAAWCMAWAMCNTYWHQHMKDTHK